MSSNEPRLMNQNVAMIATRRRPKVRRARELVEHAAVAIDEVRAYDVVRGRVDEIPIVDVLAHVLQILLVDAPLLALRTFRVAIDEEEERDQPFFVQR